MAKEAESLAIALRALARRSRSRKDVISHLTRKGIPQDAIDTVVARLEESGLIDDEKTARERVEQERRKGYGAYRVSQKLRTDGIERDTAETAIEVEWSEDQELLLALKVLQKKYRDPDPDDRQKAYAMLARRGFSGDIARRALDRHFQPNDS